MLSFIKLQVKIISATDLMSRGLDTHDVSILRSILVVEKTTNFLKVTHVINYDFPLNPSDYIHRAGRVGRVGGAKVKHLQKTLLV